MGRVDDHAELSIETYMPVKTWILQREVKLNLRKNTRIGKGKSPDDMVYGVSAPPPSEPTGDIGHFRRRFGCPRGRTNLWRIPLFGRGP